MRVSRLVLSALLISASGCAAAKPATDLTYRDVPPDRIADQIFLADSIAAVERCRPFPAVRVAAPNFVSPPPADDGCGGSARAEAGQEYVNAVTRITGLHDAVVHEWEARLGAGPEAAQARSMATTMLRCLDLAGFAQRGPGEASLESYGVGAADAALNNAAQRCSDDTGYGGTIAAQRVRTLKSVLGEHEAEINEIAKLRPVLERWARPGDGPDGGRFGLPE